MVIKRLKDDRQQQQLDSIKDIKLRLLQQLPKNTETTLFFFIFGRRQHVLAFEFMNTVLLTWQKMNLSAN